jgi:hypothetical protein
MPRPRDHTNTGHTRGPFARGAAAFPSACTGQLSQESTASAQAQGVVSGLEVGAGTGPGPVVHAASACNVHAHSGSMDRSRHTHTSTTPLADVWMIDIYYSCSRCVGDRSRSTPTATQRLPLVACLAPLGYGVPPRQRKRFILHAKAPRFDLRRPLVAHTRRARRAPGTASSLYIQPQRRWAPPVGRLRSRRAARVEDTQLAVYTTRLHTAFVHTQRATGVKVVYASCVTRCV